MFGFRYASDLTVYSKGDTIMSEEYVAYCVKCKTKRPMQGAQVLTNEKGRRMAKGTCPECGTKMTLFLKSQK